MSKDLSNEERWTLSLLDEARSLLESLRRQHYECDEDPWYSCPKSIGGCSNDRNGTDCNCNAETVNYKIDKMLAKIDVHFFRSTDYTRAGKAEKNITNEQETAEIQFSVPQRTLDLIYHVCLDNFPPRVRYNEDPKRMTAEALDKSERAVALILQQLSLVDRERYCLPSSVLEKRKEGDT